MLLRNFNAHNEPLVKHETLWYRFIENEFPILFSKSMFKYNYGSYDLVTRSLDKLH